MPRDRKKLEGDDVVKAKMTPNKKPKYEEDAKKAEAEQKGLDLPSEDRQELTPIAYSDHDPADLVKVVIIHHNCYVADNERAYKGDKVMVPLEVAEALENKNLATTV